MWYHRTAAEDGPFYRLFKTEEKAKASLEKDVAGGERSWLGRVDQWGRTHSVDRCPLGIKTARQMLAIERAYDARECETATKSQLALLDRYGL